MTGIIFLVLTIAGHIGLTIQAIREEDRKLSLRLTIYAAALAILTLGFISGILTWSFSYLGLYTFLLIYTAAGVIRRKVFRKETKKGFTTGRAVRSCIGSVLLMGVLFFPMILFPVYQEPAVTGDYQIADESYTYTDEQRLETYTEQNENRKVTVQFWYPEDAEEGETFPLIIFSHGAFGYRMSNYSTFQELASNGYVVCSIDHPYHAFFTEHTDGTTVIADMQFLNDAMNSSDYEEEKIHELSTAWLEIRTGDINFVLDKIIEETGNEHADAVFKKVDIQKIGLSGHSLGGAAAAQTGRIRSDISAVICIDGTMLGESVDFVDGAYVLNDEPYPVPLLNFYNQDHYEQMQESPDYQNTNASSNAAESYDILIENAGHLNFTDLPLVSPLLAKLLGTGEVDAKECIESMNETVLSFFDYTLKDGDSL